MAGPDVDAELIQMSASLFQALDVSRELRLELNTLGSANSRRSYRDALVQYLTPLRAQLDPDSQRRLERNPLRILDSKDPKTQALLEGAPSLSDHLDAGSKAHFDGLRRLLDALQIGYVINPRLVRGLDYYTHTVFEWVTDALGSQGTVCAGGRYDGLVEQLGGRPTPGAGFAIGVDRLVLLHEALALDVRAEPIDGYCVILDEAHTTWAMSLCQRVREALPDVRLRTNAGGGKLKNQMKRAGARAGRADIEPAGETLVAGSRLETLGHALHQIVQVEGRHVELEPSGIELGEIENVVENGEQASRRLMQRAAYLF